MPELVRQSIVIKLPPSDRAVFFGRTGSGKTTLAKVLLNGRRRFVVLDAKHTFRMPGVPITPAFDPKLPRQIIRVPMDDFERERWEWAIEQIWRLSSPDDTEGSTLYIDETTLINPSAQKLSIPLGKAIRTGRERQLGVWCGSQRPKDIPSAIFTEAEHIFCFSLGFDKDREKVASFSDKTFATSMERLRGHNFAYYDVREGRSLIFQPVKPISDILPVQPSVLVADRKGETWDSSIRRWLSGR